MPLTEAEILARCPLFAELADEDVQALALVARRRNLESGESLFMAGARAKGLAVVVSGRVKVYVISPASGREVVLTMEHPFNAVAELVSLDGGPYPASAEAAEASEVLWLEQSGFQRVLRERPQVALHLMGMLGRRLRRLVALVEQISFQEVIQRLARYLLEVAQSGVPFVLDTNGVIAAQLGTVPELVSRNLSRLHAGGIVELQGRKVTGLDFAQLEEMARSAGR
ncbi:MAG TPA: Crp/Fnr family transcriptional regulator [Trueperaceae bacterium]|nr:Crp/Fnr family transcriptional regulator [Trueperaceae bacterium]